jgi:uncharacterized protein
VYLLNQLGLETDLHFFYHEYGPFSPDLSFAVDVAKAERWLTEEERRRDRDRVPYSVFSVQPGAPLSNEIREQVARYVKIIQLLANSPAVVLELAASAHYLKEHGHSADWEAEVGRRKGPKTEGGRLLKAVSLLKELNLT